VKLICLSHTTTAHCFGGVETHVATVARMAAQLGHAVTVITTAHPRGVREETQEGVRSLYLAGTKPSVLSRTWRERSVAEVRRCLARENADLILSFSMAGYAVAKARLGVPHYACAYVESLDHVLSEWHNISGLRGVLAYPRRAGGLLYCGLVERRIWRMVDGVIATHDRLHERLQRLGVRTYLAYNGIEVDRYRRDATVRQATRQALGIPPSAAVLLMVGTVNRQKGMWLGAEAFLRLAGRDRDLHLLVVGDGPDLEKIRARLGDSPHAARAHITGSVDLDRLPALYMAGDLYAHPSLRVEGLPYTLLYALAAGLPVVAADRGGVGCAVKDGVTGLLVKAGDADALTQAVEALRRDPSRAQALAQAGRQHAAANFDLRTILTRLFGQLGRKA